MSEVLHVDLICSLVKEINDRFKLIVKMFPKDGSKEHLLHDLAAASIHVTLFMGDLVLVNDESVEKKHGIRKELRDKFLEECGCKDE